jgi:ubiquinone/menaquinone biosynthesis C-methylase UbiE
MNNTYNYVSINKASWNKRVDAHISSDFYDMKGFLAGETSLKEIELSLLGNINGLNVLHLQCHFGQDSISLSRMGASVTGVDLSDKAIEKARDLAQQTGSTAQFICSDIYELPAHLNQQFDIVFTSYGTIGWLPDLDKWADIVSRFLKPGGKFVFVEFHPVVWMYDDDFEKVAYNYFKADPIHETESGTYADREANISIESVSWNHSLSEVFSSLINHGITINSFEEYDYSPYNCFKNTIEVEPGKYRIRHLNNFIPIVYSLSGTKK